MPVGEKRLRRRQAAHAWGRVAEGLAAWWLRLKGYRVVAHGFRARQGEIDLIARRGTVLAFVEVKARASPEAALVAVTNRQQRRIGRAAAAFLSQRPELAALSPRFDVIVLSPWRRPRHLVDAWRESV
jgi:putative endonuclease